MIASTTRIFLTLIFAFGVISKTNHIIADESLPLDEYPGFSSNEKLNFLTEQIRRLQTDLLHELIDECMSEKGFEYRRTPVISKIELRPLDSQPKQLSFLYTERSIYEDTLGDNFLKSKKNNSTQYNQALYGTELMPKYSNVRSKERSASNCYDISFDSILHVYGARAKLIDEYVDIYARANADRNVTKALETYKRCMSEYEFELEHPDDYVDSILKALQDESDTVRALLTKSHNLCKSKSEYYDKRYQVLTYNRESFAEKNRASLEASKENIQKAIEQLIMYGIVSSKNELNNRFKYYQSEYSREKWDDNLNNAAQIQCSGDYEVVDEQQLEQNQSPDLLHGWSEIRCL